MVIHTSLNFHEGDKDKALKSSNSNSNEISVFDQSGKNTQTENLNNKTDGNAETLLNRLIGIADGIFGDITRLEEKIDLETKNLIEEKKLQSTDGKNSLFPNTNSKKRTFSSLNVPCIEDMNDDIDKRPRYNWHERFEHLKAYKERNGHCVVRKLMSCLCCISNSFISIAVKNKSTF